MYGVVLNLPNLINFEKWNILAQYITEIWTPKNSRPREIAITYSSKLNAMQIDHLKKTLEIYSSWAVLSGPYPHITGWGVLKPYFLMKFETFNNRDTVIGDLQRIKQAGVVVNFQTGETKGGFKTIDIPLIPLVENNNNNDNNKKNTLNKISESLKPYQNYIIVALAVLLLVLIIQKK